jgi:hypothetical protein
MDQIRHRAYELWLEEGCPDGRDRIHWLHAEAEFRERLQPKACVKEGAVRKTSSAKRGREPSNVRQDREAVPLGEAPQLGGRL